MLSGGFTVVWNLRKVSSMSRKMRIVKYLMNPMGYVQDEVEGTEAVPPSREKLTGNERFRPDD